MQVIGVHLPVKRVAAGSPETPIFAATEIIIMRKHTLVLFAAAAIAAAHAQTEIRPERLMEKLRLTETWDKTFPRSEKVNHSKVTFVNRYGITLAADMYVPKDAAGKLPAIAVCGPFGAVKEQAAGLYAQTMAERGFLTVAFDPSYTGESGGEPRYVVSPDINTEDFSAAVDFLATNDKVDPEQIGIIGICGWGGLAINAAAADPRIKATVASTMYDMSRVSANGYFDADNNAEARNAQHNAPRISATASRNRAAAFRMYCLPTLRSSSRTTTPITRHRAAITNVRSTPIRDGMQRKPSRSSTSR